MVCLWLSEYISISNYQIIGPLFEQPVASLLPPGIFCCPWELPGRGRPRIIFFYVVGVLLQTKCALIKLHSTLGEFVNSAWPHGHGFGNNPDAHLETIVDHSDSCCCQVFIIGQIRNWPLNSWLWNINKLYVNIL